MSWKLEEEQCDRHSQATGKLEEICLCAERKRGDNGLQAGGDDAKMVS